MVTALRSSAAGKSFKYCSCLGEVGITVLATLVSLCVPSTFLCVQGKPWSAQTFGPVTVTVLPARERTTSCVACKLAATAEYDWFGDVERHSFLLTV